MKLKININFKEKKYSSFCNWYWISKNYKKKLEEYDLMADVDDQRFHYFYS